MIDKTIYITGIITWIAIAIACLLATMYYLLVIILFFKQHNRKALKGIVKRLFCRHNYISYETMTWSTDEKVTSKSEYYRCSKCYKSKTVYLKIKPNTPTP